MATPGVTFSANGATVFQAPGLVSDLSPRAWDQQTMFLPSFGLKGVSVLYGERTTRPFVVPMMLWDTVTQWTTDAEREAALNAIIAKQGQVGTVLLANYAGTPLPTAGYANCFFDRLELVLRRNDAPHGYWARVNLFFMEIAS